MIPGEETTKETHIRDAMASIEFLTRFGKPGVATQIAYQKLKSMLNDEVGEKEDENE